MGVDNVKKDFPMLQKNDLTYLDSACMSLRPQSVIDKINEYYTEYSGCSGRSGHSISREADKELEKARKKVAEFIGAEKDDLVFTSGTTESINTVAQGLDFERVFLTEKEHNSNRAIWQKLGVETVNMKSLDPEFLKENLTEGDLVSILHVSNLDGEAYNLGIICDVIHESGAYSMIDAAQSIPHRPFSVKEVKADFVAFSGHKMLGPTGTGGLYVKREVQKELEPLKFGGGAVKSSTFNDYELADFPQGFEPGLQNLAGFTGLGAAIDYLEEFGMENVEEKERKLTEKLVSGLQELDLKVLNEGPGIVSVVPESMSPNEAAEILDRRGVKVRAGRHCVHPWFEDKDFNGTLRASLHLYNNEKDIERFVKVMKKISAL